ncbi:MAG: phospholipase D-like domain-containing protein [Elusimicrobiota bacterium]
MIKITANRSTAALFTLIFSVISVPGVYSQTAYNALAAGAARPNVPAASAPRTAGSGGGEKSFISRESRKIISMDDKALAAVPPEQRLQMVKTLMSDSNPNQNNDNTDWDQKDLEKAILRVLAAAPDAAAFDFVYYRLNRDDLERKAGWYQDVRDLVNKFRGTAVPGDWDGLNKYVNNVTKAVDSGSNLIKFLIDGKELIPEAKEALAGAQRSIHVEVFQLQADNIGQGLADLLSAKAKAGVKVRLLIDEHGSKVDDDQPLRTMLDGMKANGVSVIIKKPPFFKDHLDHRKVVVLDGKTGFTGGMNIGRWYQVDWHDQQTLIKGPAVARLQDAFVERWRNAGGSFGADEDLYPAIEEYQDGYQTKVVTHIGKGDQNIKAMYLRAIGTAQKTISIANPYFTDEDVIDALRAAARRGVKVRLVLPQDNDMAIVQHASRASYPKLAKAGVQIYEYKGRMAHEKVAVMDGRWATFGSSNLDERSLRNNDELNLIITDFRLVQDIEIRLFDADLPNCELMNNYSPDILDHMAHQVSGLL